MTLDTDVHNPQIIYVPTKLNGAMKEGWSEVKMGENDKVYISIDLVESKMNQMIEKACDWLSENLKKETFVLTTGQVHIDFQKAIKEFKKAMKEGE